MKPVSQSEILQLISDINMFADEASKLLDSTLSRQEAEKRSAQGQINSGIKKIKDQYGVSIAMVKQQSEKTLGNSLRMLDQVLQMDSKLASVDKYYKRTKDKKTELLSGVTSNRYDQVEDFFDAMTQIRESFDVIYQKYSSHILPSVINGLNYLLSAQRKKDYEELIVLKNTLDVFVKTVQEELPAIEKQECAAMEAESQKQTDAFQAKGRETLALLSAKHNGELDALSDRLWDVMDQVLPDSYVEYLVQLEEHYAQGFMKVNAAGAVCDENLNMMYILYPIDLFVENRTVASVIRIKCEKLLEGSQIVFPYIWSIENAPVWLIKSDQSSQSRIQSFTHSVMFGMLSSLPVASLTYDIIDPENRGSSVFPFFDAKKKLPDLFGDGFYVTKETISKSISKLNETVEYVLQEKLGNEYGNIYGYSKDHEDAQAESHLLVIYDFPKGFDARSLSELRNIMRNGSRCGIYTLITYDPTPSSSYSRETENSINSILELASVIEQSGDSFLLFGLELSFFFMPDKAQFSKFFGKYMLIYEGIKNRGIAFPPLIKRLAQEKDASAAEECMQKVCDILKDYETSYGRVPDADKAFSSCVTLGQIRYPADLFSEGAAYDQILKLFGNRNEKEDGSGYVQLPLTFDLCSPFNLYLECPAENKDAMTAFSHHVIWTFLSALPVTKVNVCVFDTMRGGSSVLPFLDFRKSCPDVFDGKIYTSSEEIRERLLRFNRQIDEFIQEKLGNRYENIIDYNIHTLSRSEPVTLLFIYDFPGGTDQRSLDLLANIIRNGSRCGIYTVICHDPDIAFARYENMDDRIENIVRFCSQIDYKEGTYSLLPYSLPVMIPDKPSGKQADEFTREYASRCDMIRNRGLSFEDILPDELFASTSEKAFSIPVGIGDADSIVSVRIGEGSSHHGLIAGATGSGKSTLLHTLIMSAMLNYSPDQLHLYLMDFKSGTEFKIYESVRLPHIQLLALDAMQEFGESILEDLVAEMERRGRLFKEEGQTSLKGYVTSSSRPMPRILVIMDEFQILFNDATNRKVANHCAQLTKRLVTEGRAFGIHLLMSTQSTKVLAALTLEKGVIEQMRIRIGLKCSDNDARYMFSDANEAKALSMMKGPIGTAVMNLDYMEQANVGMRAVYCDDKTQEKYLKIISERFADSPYQLQVFEGGRTTKLLDYFRAEKISRTARTPVQIHMGELIKVAPPLALEIDKKKKHNLLICGSNEEMARMVADDYMICAVLNENAQVYCMDGDTMVGEDTSGDIYRLLEKHCPNFHVARGGADVIVFLRKLYEKYLERKKQNNGDTIFVVIKNLQFFDLVQMMLKGERFDESEYVDDEPEAAQADAAEMAANPFAAVLNMSSARKTGKEISTGEKLVKMIADGSGLGINFVVSSLEYQTVHDTMFGMEKILSRFPERIIFSLGDNDAFRLIESVSISALRDNTVFYTDGVKNTFQMKPFITPSASALEEFLVSIERTGGEIS